MSDTVGNGKTSNRKLLVEEEVLPESERKHAKICRKCSDTIEEEYILRVAGSSWHSKCLTCAVCGKQLTGKCHMIHERFYCLLDYNRLFALKCSKCEKYLDHSGLIHRSGTRVYHVNCFHCVVCSQQFNTGDMYYVLADGSLVCKLDYECDSVKGDDCAGKRPRTTINNQQLESLRAAYKESKKPSRHVRERLSLQTGLDMRVVQVWFQNRRAKDKRTHREQFKQEVGESRDSSDSDGNDLFYYEQGRSRIFPQTPHQFSNSAFWLPAAPSSDVTFPQNDAYISTVASIQQEIALQSNQLMRPFY